MDYDQSEYVQGPQQYYGQQEQLYGQQQEYYQQPTSMVGSTYNSVSELGNKMYNWITNNPLTELMSQPNTATNFITSNDYIYRAVFVFLVVVICIIILKVFMSKIAHAYVIKSDILLINGTIDAQTPMTITQNIHDNPNTLVMPSRNKPGGLEFTWSVWIYITLLDSSSLFSNVFFKGAYTSNQCNNINQLTNGPGVYLLNNSETNSATLYVIMDTFTSPGVFIDGKCDMSNAIQVPHLPIGEWIHVCFGVQDRNMDVYINGIITSSVRLVGIPKQNNGDIYIANNKGFQGKISSLRYISRKITIEEILNIYKQGPNVKEIVPKKMQSNFKDYLSFAWYTK